MEPGAIAFEDFAYHQFLAKKAPRGYWHHLQTWLAQRDNPDVLLLCYEDLQPTFSATLPTIAAFIGVELDSELEEIVLRQSSLDFMREHGSHFDDHFLHLARHETMGIPKISSSSKVSSKEASRNRPQPSKQLITDMQARWEREVTPQTGFEDYAALKRWFSDRD